MSGRCRLTIASSVIFLLLLCGPPVQAEKGWWDYLRENGGSYRDAVAAVGADMAGNADDDPLLVVRGFLRVGYAQNLRSMNRLSLAIYDEFCRLVEEEFPDSLDVFLAAQASMMASRSGRPALMRTFMNSMSNSELFTATPAKPTMAMNDPMVNVVLVKKRPMTTPISANGTAEMMITGWK